jgi:hypothetical protein
MLVQQKLTVFLWPVALQLFPNIRGTVRLRSLVFRGAFDFIYRIENMWRDKNEQIVFCSLIRLLPKGPTDQRCVA